MLGHDDIAHDHKAIAPAHPLQDFEQQVAMLRFRQQRQSTEATGSDEVETSGAVVALEFVGHEEGVARDAWFCM
ncbi:MAG: hypothetical protein ABSA78_01845 [Candidatus Sulfotelmatobacter sp.]